MEAISSQHTTSRCDRIHVITACRAKTILRKNDQENISIFNKIIHIQANGNKIISLAKTIPIPYHFDDVVKISLRNDWYD